MTRDGLVEINSVTGEVTNVSKRDAEVNLRGDVPERIEAAPTPRRKQPRPASEPEGFSQTEKNRQTQPYQPVEDAVPINVPPAGAPALLPTPDTPTRKLTKAQHHADHAAQKLASARKALPAKHKLRTGAVLDEQSGTMKRRLHFEPEVMTQREHLKGALPLRPVKAAGNSALAFAHRKLYQVQHENVGTEAAHKAEIAIEGAARTALRHDKTASYRKVKRLEHSAAKSNTKLAYQKALSENPRLQSNPLSRMAQKRKIKRDYAKAARKSAKQAQKAASASTKATKALAGVVKRHPVATVLVVLVVLLLYMLVSLVGAFGSIGSGGLGGMLSGTYLATDAEIEAVTLAYGEWETDLRLLIADTEALYPGYGEYVYRLGSITHDPHQLLAHLTAKHQAFTYSAVEAELMALFAAQYALSFASDTVTRYADPNDADEDGDLQPYDVTVLTVTLAAQPFVDVLAARMDGGQSAQFAVLMQTYGLRQLASSPFAFDWRPYVTSLYGYRVHPVTGEKNLHRGLDIGLPTGTEIRAVQGGTVTFSGDSGNYGNLVIIENADGLSSKYAHCDSLLVAVGQLVSVGDVIATVGSTGQSTGPHLHLEILQSGEYLNPLLYVGSGY